MNSPVGAPLKGRIAIANAKLAYRAFQECFNSREFAEQRRRGARVQRPLWASTSAKDPQFRDVLYVENLIGADTVNTVPPATLDAFQAHGELRATLEEDVGKAEQDLDRLNAAGVDLTTITDGLERDGVAKFAESYDALLALLERKRFEVSKEYASG
jgi:transaldolase